MLRPVTRAAVEVEPLWRQGLGEQLRADRARRGERIADVAHRAGVSPQYLSELERGKKDPSSEIMSAVAGALDLTVAELTLSVSAAGGHAAGDEPTLRTRLPGRLTQPGRLVMTESTTP